MKNDLMKKLSAGLGIFLLVIGGLWLAWTLTTDPADKAEKDEIEKVSIEITEEDHKKGNPEGIITLVEFSDFQCPACKMYAPVVKQLLDDFGKEVNFVYKNFPLPQHNVAEVAALAAEAAGKQDKFFEMHDILFERQDIWSTDKNPEKLFEAYAKELKLDVKKFNLDMASKEVKDKVKADTNVGTQVGVSSTPSFYLDGVKLDVPQSYADFAALIQQKIDEVKAATPTGGEPEVSVTGGAENISGTPVTVAPTKAAAR